MEPLGSEGLIEGSVCGEDGGEIMVEVVGSDVFVDGVGGNWNGEEGSGELVKEGLERKMESVDGKGGGVIGGLASQAVAVLDGQVCEARIETRVKGVQEFAGSSYEQTKVAAEETFLRANEEGLEMGEELVNRGGDASDVLGSNGASILHDEAQNSGIETGMGGSLIVSGSSCEQPEVVAERVVVTVSEQGMEKGLKSVAGGGGTLDELPSQRGGNLDCELWNPGIGAAVVCSSSITQSSSMQTPVVAEEVAMMVNDEFLNNKDEVSGSAAEEGNLTDSENNHCSVAETVCVGTDKHGAIQLNVESLNQSVELVCGEVGATNKEDILHPRGKFCCSVEDQQMKVETAVENTERQGDLHADPISSCEPTMAVAGCKATTVDDKVSSDPNVGAPKAVVLDGVGVDAGEVGIVSSDLGSSIEQAQVAADYLVAHDSKMSISSTITLAGSGRELSTTENRVLGASDVNLDYVGDQELKVNSMGGGSERDAAVCAAPHSSYEQSKVLNDNEVSMMDSKVSNSEVEIPTADDMGKTVACSEDDQNKKCETIVEIAGKDGHVLADLVSSNEQACSMGKDGIARGHTQVSGDQILIDNQVEPSVLECLGTVHVPACCTFDDNISLLEKAEELKVETLGKNAVEDPFVGVDFPPIGDRSSHIQTCSDSLEDNTSLRNEKQETVAQLADMHTHEVDGDQGMNMLIVEETPAQGVCDVTLSNTVVEGTATGQAALNCGSTHNEGDHVSSSVGDFMGSLLDEHQNLEVRMVSSGISLLNGNQTIVTCVSDAVNSDEVATSEAKVESHKADEQVPEGQFVNKYMVGSLVVDLDTCLSKDGKWKPQDESVKENIFPDESPSFKDVQSMGGNVELEFSECLDGSATGDLCLDGSSVGQEVEVEEQYTDAEQVDLYGGQEIATREQLKLVEDENSEQTILKPGNFAKVDQANSLLPTENEGGFSVSDLVWGKVKSHPWWPGQIFDPADASERAMKHHKKDCFLVAYFGDQTFAWNEACLLKPFWSNFAQTEKSSNSEIFQNAVSCALEEVTRRVELGLACSCIPKDAYDEIESQIIENTGICQESSRRYGVDKSTSVSSFEPVKLVEYIRALAQCPSADADDQLELVIAKAQLLAFNRLKGYRRLPEFQFCGGLLEIDADSSQLGEVIDHGPNNERIFSSKGRLKAENSSSHKRKHNLRDSVYPRKKERSLSELMGDIASSPDGEDGSDWKASSKSVSLSSGKKRKAIDFISDVSVVQDRRISFYAAKVSTTASPTPKPSFKVGECISRVASQLTGSPSILKCSSEKFQKVDGSSDVPVGFDVSLQTPENSQKGRMVFPMEYSSLDEIVSQLHLAAENPRKGYKFLTTIITFFAGFRNSISFSGRQNSSTGKLGGGRKKKASHAIIGYPEEFEFDDVNDSYWTDRIIQNNSEEQPSGESQNREGEYQLVAFDPDKSLKSSRRSYSRKRFSNGNHTMTIEEPIGYIDEGKRDNLPTELILNFSEGHSIPSEMNLNKIFRRFGPLKDSETEVDLETSRARVVFKRCSDAEVAFSSAGKFNIFGPTIVNYQLSYSPSISFKTLPLATSQGQEDAT